MTLASALLAMCRPRKAEEGYNATYTTCGKQEGQHSPLVFTPLVRAEVPIEPDDIVRIKEA